MQKIVPMLWFNTEAEEAVKFYCSIFKNSHVTAVTRYTDLGPGPDGSVMTIAFELDGNPYVALNGGPTYTFTEAISLMVYCEDQTEVDRIWDGLLSGGGKPVACGWLKDQYGLAWQVVPTELMQMIADPDAAKVRAAMAAMMNMVKLDIAALRAAVRAA